MRKETNEVFHLNHALPTTPTPDSTNTFQIQIDKSDYDHYRTCFFKRRILQEWHHQRRKVKLSQYDQPAKQKMILTDTFLQLRSFIAAAYVEDFSLPLSEFTLFGWLQYNKLRSEICQEAHDRLYWSEMIYYYEQCSKSGIIAQLLPLK
ncbi:hypothetical protein IC620_15835 [Hazenella sp. IB182357]|uniref:Uncharacterized protein n=1 Tax=Polycladospora coralii TaxID=2771432 RepID=A0A926RUD7_9BACL|nr:hypothetical protein [Polycladospora coralii]MBD1373815.1 hypothetical protein [Polycladospora coralii]MBS7531982.1 hypothetical protein [Polycladospora coralii]